jgi:peptide/nickel transport system substrate-binding protein
MQSALAMVVIISPEARTSRHVRDAFEVARLHHLPVYGVWIAGERWQDCLPEGSVELIGPIDARTDHTPPQAQEMATALAQATRVLETTSIVGADASPTAPLSLPAEGPLFRSLGHRLWRGMPPFSGRLLQGLLAVVMIGAVLGSAGAANSGAAVQAARGGTWIEAISDDPHSLIPNAAPGGDLIDQALYLPLFYGDPSGLIHPGAATEVPSLRNGDISLDGRTWTFHLRPHLVWSDGQPYDARDVDYTWRLWLDPAFGAYNPAGDGLSQISSATVSADHLSIVFHLKQAYAPFLQYWVDGLLAPLPAHHFRSMAPETIHQSADNLDPTVTSGPFLLRESVHGDHYTLERNPRYYRAGAGLPYLDRVVFRVVSEEAGFQALQAGTITSYPGGNPTSGLDLDKLPTYERLTKYRLVAALVSARFEALVFNWHNIVLASHPEVRQAMSLAIDRQALVTVARNGYASPLCTDHPSGIHPGYEPADPENCPELNLAAANMLLDDSGWVKGPDGVRTRHGQRLEFEYSTTTHVAWRNASQAIVQRDFMAIGIKLDIQNYSEDGLYGTLLPRGDASPPTGAVADHYDIAEYGNQFGYDPDDSFLWACDQIPPNGFNFSFYCNPALDALYQQELRAVEPGTRQKLFDGIHNIDLTDLPFIVLYSTTDLAIARKGTHNYLPSPIASSTVNIWEWWCDRGNCQGGGNS